jgi:hypothetical protein
MRHLSESEEAETICRGDGGGHLVVDDGVEAHKALFLAKVVAGVADLVLALVLSGGHPRPVPTGILSLAQHARLFNFGRHLGLSVGGGEVEGIEDVHCLSAERW